MDFEFIREQTPLYIEAAKLTLHMAVIGVILAIIVMYDAMCVADREPEITRKECDELMKHYFGIWTFVIYVKKYTDKIAGLFEKM